ncbi:hypothetical protein [Mesorhizobium sp. CN2-181]|uniref:hypothetical protein n=1 Tax=Mesorhizobium yinganensis TaxID=3157707 RepID=UPI0032B78FCE
MTIDEAIAEACQQVGIVPPRNGYRPGRWVKTDTLSGKNGKGDGRVIVNDVNVTAFNWQTNETSTVWMTGEVTAKQRREIAQEIERENRRRVERAARASALASRMVEASRLSTHPYLVRKGFSEEKALVLGAADVLRLAADPAHNSTGEYLVSAGGERAIVMPARIGHKITSLQLIWEDGTKKFIFGGAIECASHRIATGVDTWLCEGFATGLSLRAALHGLGLRSTVLCCFSAANVAAVARRLSDRRIFLGTDNDKPLPQYGGLGTGEYFARQADRPYGMPPVIGNDFNDMHQKDGIFAVQRVLTSVMAGRCPA